MACEYSHLRAVSFRHWQINHVKSIYSNGEKKSHSGLILLIYEKITIWLQNLFPTILLFMGRSNYFYPTSLKFSKNHILLNIILLTQWDSNFSNSRIFDPFEVKPFSPALILPQIPGKFEKSVFQCPGGVWPASTKTLTLFMTKICDFPCHIYDLTKNLIPYL